jgi:hypothetical protein
MFRNKRGKDRQRRKRREKKTSPSFSRYLPVVAGGGLGAAGLGTAAYLLTKPKRLLKNRMVNQAKELFTRLEDDLVKDIEKYKIKNPNKSLALELQYAQAKQDHKLRLERLQKTSPEKFMEEFDKSLDKDRFVMEGVRLKDELKIKGSGKLKNYAIPKEYKPKLLMANTGITAAGVGLGGYLGSKLGNDYRVSREDK